jgi:hypothetical protein
MTYDLFRKVINNLSEHMKRSRAMHRLGIDLIEYDELLVASINDMLKEEFGDKYEWIEWFCYDNDFGKGNLTATDHGKDICYDIKSLYDYTSHK